MTESPHPHTYNLNTLPHELILQILHYLDIPDLLSLTRTTHPLRTLSHDPLLHRHRLLTARFSLSTSLPLRPSLSDLRPPSSTIYLSRTHILARNLGRQLISIRLSRNLLRRPSASSLVGRDILKGECWEWQRVRSCGSSSGPSDAKRACSSDGKRGGEGYLPPVAPGIVNVKRRVERERVKDNLRDWLGGKKHKSEWERRRAMRAREEKRGVRDLVRRFRAWAVDGDVAAPSVAGGSGSGRARVERWSEKAGKEAKREDPPARAHVLGLRRFWEGLASGASRGEKV